MLFRLWEALQAYFKDKPYWPALQPIFALLSLYLTAVVVAREYIEWRYGFAPEPSLYVHSYVFKQISLVFAALVAVTLLFRLQDRRRDPAASGRLASLARVYGKRVLGRAILVALVFALTVPLFIHWTPHRASHIRIRFLQEPDFDKYAFAYLVYELNRLQRDWYFEIDFDTFNEEALTSAERARCSQGERSLCWAKQLAAGQPLIAITTEQLGEDFFWRNEGEVSVLSTFGWTEQYAPPSVYQFLAYSLVVNGIVIHLNDNCSGLPRGAFAQSRSSYGDLFQFSPRRNQLRAAILAAHLSPSGQELLFNCFGAGYAGAAGNALALDWLRSPRVSGNLEQVFHVEP